MSRHAADDVPYSTGLTRIDKDSMNGMAARARRRGCGKKHAVAFGSSGTRRHFSGFLHVTINVDIATADLTNPSYGPQMSLIEVDVLVIGAGPTGLGAATRLNMHKKESWVSRERSPLGAWLRTHTPHAAAH